ncbi:protein-glutamate O-methyltransferase CheR [bacterium]|nr:protein-glutamate O-methyltransferase CheR [bacterium]
MILTPDEFTDFTNFIKDKFGLIFKSNKIELLSKVIENRLEFAGFKKNSEYIEYLKNSFGISGEHDYLVENLTTRETSFFRFRPQLESLEKKVLPEIFEQKVKSGEKELRIWSAGISTGEEPYTIGLILDKLIPLRRTWNIDILGTDITKDVLKTAAVCRYPIESLKEIPEEFHKKLVIMSNYFTIMPDIKKMMTFKFLNLINEIYPVGMDIIMCRNVMIYFSHAIRSRIFEKFYRCLNKGGYLFLGHTESMQSFKHGFKQNFVKDAVYYTKE